ncbi:collagen alpha-1(I) chain-like [Ursus americanus]|uniref:collagen alpha-1(I) chain-like n=1 Tax=Ursus americanus TaxID=9643 RepID=UPI001E679454|nr:collagen alpha-1(I) chain-like [Ursus americanus]
MGTDSGANSCGESGRLGPTGHAAQVHKLRSGQACPPRVVPRQRARPAVSVAIQRRGLGAASPPPASPASPGDRAGTPRRRERAPGAPLPLVAGRAEPGRAATPRAAGPPSPGSAGAGAGASSGTGAARGGPARGAVGRSPGAAVAAAAAAAAEDGARGARTWRPARGRGQGRLLRRAAAPRAGAAASMAPSPRTSSRQDATALPSMSSTFWAFMILASLLIAYCSEYRAARAPARPSGPGPGPSPTPGPGPGGRQESVRSCQLAARRPRVPPLPAGPGGRGAARAPGARALRKRAPPPSLPPRLRGRAREPGPGGAAMPRAARCAVAAAPGPGRRAEASRALRRQRQVRGRRAAPLGMSGERPAQRFPLATLPPGTRGDAAAAPERGASGGSGARARTRGCSLCLPGKQTRQNETTVDHGDPGGRAVAESWDSPARRNREGDWCRSRPSELEFGGARPPPEPRGFCRASLSPGGPPEPHGEPPALVGEAAAFHTRAHSGFPDPAQERELNLWAGSTGWLDGWAFQKRRAAGRRSGRAGLLRKALRLRLWGGPGPAPRRRLPENGRLGLVGCCRSCVLLSSRSAFAAVTSAPPRHISIVLGGACASRLAAQRPHLGLPIEWKLCASSPAHWPGPLLQFVGPQSTRLRWVAWLVREDGGAGLRAAGWEGVPPRAVRQDPAPGAVLRSTRGLLYARAWLLHQRSRAGSQAGVLGRGSSAAGHLVGSAGQDDGGSPYTPGTLGPSTALQGLTAPEWSSERLQGCGWVQEQRADPVSSSLTGFESPLDGTGWRGPPGLVGLAGDQVAQSCVPRSAVSCGQSGQSRGEMRLPSLQHLIGWVDGM